MFQGRPAIFAAGFVAVALSAAAPAAADAVRPLSRPTEVAAPLANPVASLNSEAVGATPAAVSTSPEATTTALSPSWVTAARDQIGVTTTYDPAYMRLDFPNGDVPRSRGVCTDVVIRALRDAEGVDLQRAVNRDMTARFAAYPQNWGLRRPDRNIDHRRVPNLIELFDHAGARVSADPQAGDIVTVMLPGNLPHIMIVSDRRTADGRPLVIHNIGRGTREEDALDRYPQTGHFRLSSVALEKLRQLDQ